MAPLFRDNPKSDCVTQTHTHTHTHTLLRLTWNPKLSSGDIPSTTWTHPGTLELWSFGRPNQMLSALPQGSSPRENKEATFKAPLLRQLPVGARGGQLSNGQRLNRLSGHGGSADADHLRPMGRHGIVSRPQNPQNEVCFKLPFCQAETDASEEDLAGEMMPGKTEQNETGSFSFL